METVLAAARTSSSNWKAAFNRGDAAGCAKAYAVDATMTAEPFGTFFGREAIEGFWQQIIDQGYSDVEYIDPEMTVLDDRTVLLKSGWRMNKAHGVITKELWVLQPDGTALLTEDAFEVQG
ncbi:isochorismatase [Roseibium hamelinense]|nr:isochorismatase [Roseibium hamelinense]